MPVYQLPDEIAFPHPSLAEDEGLLAVGGDLSPERLLTAYANGIFPWYSEGDPIMWWSPDPRLVMYPQSFKVSKSLRQRMNSGQYRISMDTSFPEVIRACASIFRKDEEGTWIVPEMEEAYIALHRLGFAHSVEVWDEEELCGGLYGVSIGAVFFGESMFHKQRDASKIAFYHLCQFCIENGLSLIDAQVQTEHLMRLGACQISREQFLSELDEAVEKPSIRGPWTY